MDKTAPNGLRPLPAPEQVWMTQGIGAMHAYSERQMIAYALAERERLCATLAELVALREPNFQPYAEYQERVRLAWEAAERALGPSVQGNLEPTR